jgi:alpha/beta superfamily hydrolase
MENPVVVRAVEVAREVGLSTLRFNFRGVGRSTGIHAKGDGEQDDLKAALAMLHCHLPPDRLLGMAGYSFGAWVAARVAGSGSASTALCLIAPPLATLDFGRWTGRAASPARGRHRDSYCPAESLEALAGRLPRARLRTVEGADHFFFGKLFPLGEAIRDWARDWAAD